MIDRRMECAPGGGQFGPRPGIRSQRQLMEQLDYNRSCRWFAGLSPDDPVWDATSFTKNRERLQTGEVFEKFMTKLLNHPEVKPPVDRQER